MTFLKTHSALKRVVTLAIPFTRHTTTNMFVTFYSKLYHSLFSFCERESRKLYKYMCIIYIDRNICHFLFYPIQEIRNKVIIKSIPKCIFRADNSMKIQMCETFYLIKHVSHGIQVILLVRS